MQVTSCYVKRGSDGFSYIAIRQGNQLFDSIVIRNADGNFNCTDHRCVWKRTQWTGGLAAPECEHIPIARNEYAQFADRERLAAIGLEAIHGIPSNIEQNIDDVAQHRNRAAQELGQRGGIARPDRGGPDFWNPHYTVASGRVDGAARVQSVESRRVATRDELEAATPEAWRNRPAAPEPEPPQPKLPRFGQRKINLTS